LKVKVAVTRRPEIADPEGATVKRALSDLGFDEVRGVRFHRSIVVELEEGDPARARQRVEEMCRRVLVNPVLEDYVVEAEE
jgi:phosphoribosylformylglycinamidine synthase